MNIMASNSDVWDKLFTYLYDNFMFIMDIIWNTKLPLTDITIAYWLIFWMVVKLSIFAIHGTKTDYNSLAPTVSNGASSIYGGVARGGQFIGSRVSGQSLRNPHYQAPPPVYKSKKTVRVNPTVKYPHDKKLSYSKKQISRSYPKRIGTSKPNWTYSKRKR